MPNIKINEIEIFKDVVYETSLDNVVDNNILLSECNQIKNVRQEGINYSNVNGWQSGDLNIDFLEKHNLTLMKDMVKLFNMCLDEVCQKFDAKPLEVCNIWCNISNKTAYNRAHSHPKSVLSGVYYVQTQHSVDNGDLVFERERAFYDYGYVEWTKTEEKPFRQYTHVTPATGSLIIFPSHIIHRVEENHMNNDRVSISFNTAYKNNND